MKLKEKFLLKENLKNHFLFITKKSNVLYELWIGKEPGEGMTLNLIDEERPKPLSPAPTQWNSQVFQSQFKKELIEWAKGRGIKENVWSMKPIPVDPDKKDDGDVEVGSDIEDPLERAIAQGFSKMEQLFFGVFRLVGATIEFKIFQSKEDVDKLRGK